MQRKLRVVRVQAARERVPQEEERRARQVGVRPLVICPAPSWHAGATNHTLASLSCVSWVGVLVEQNESLKLEITDQEAQLEVLKDLAIPDSIQIVHQQRDE